MKQLTARVRIPGKVGLYSREGGIIYSRDGGIIYSWDEGIIYSWDGGIIYSRDGGIIYSRDGGLYIPGTGRLKRDLSNLHFQNAPSLSSGVVTQPAAGCILKMKIA